MGDKELLGSHTVGKIRILILVPVCVAIDYVIDIGLW